MSNKIKRLILYQAIRHQECYKSSIKQGFIPSKITYVIPRDALKTKKYCRKIHNHHQIRKLTYSLGSVQNDKSFISFASSLTNLKSLCLIVNVSGLDKYREVIRRLFLRKNRITEIELILRGTVAKLNFPWKALEVLKGLANLKIMMRFVSLPMLQSLCDFFKNKRNSLPSIRSQALLLEYVHPHIERINFQSVLEVVSNLEAEARKHCPYKFSFNLCNLALFDQSQLRSLSSFFENAQNLASLRLNGRFFLEAEEEEYFMKSLVKAQKLEELSWLIPPKDVSQVLGLLPDALMKLEVCKKLSLWIRSETVDPSLDNFLLSLTKVSHLQCLSLSFSRSTIPMSSSLVILGETIGKMPSLRDLTILCEKKNALLFDATSIVSLFEGVKECKNLERLSLNFYGQARHISNPEFLKLCYSLQNLKNLKAIDLKLALNSIVIDEEILEVWNKTLESISKNVMDFSLNIVNFAVPMKPKMLSVFVESFGVLKSVSTLKLSLLFCDIEAEFYEVLEKLVYRLKSLDSFVLQLCTLVDRAVAQTVRENLMKIEEILSYKAFIKCYIK